jgi:hypothetical protein
VSCQGPRGQKGQQAKGKRARRQQQQAEGQQAKGPNAILSMSIKDVCSLWKRVSYITQVQHRLFDLAVHLSSLLFHCSNKSSLPYLSLKPANRESPRHV